MSEPFLVDLSYYIKTLWSDSLNIIYDIGASDGSYSTIINSSVINEPKYYLFEANSKYAKQEHSFEFEFHNVIFSNTEKTVNFYSNGTSGDSYYKELTGVYKDVIPTERKATTLDKYCQDNNIPLPDLIKIDTQGSELDILQGGERSLANAKVVILECPLFMYNENSPSFMEYILFMYERGFVPNVPTQLHWFGQCLHQVDIAFINTRGQL